MSITPPKVTLRIGSHAEKEYFEQLAQFLDGLIFGGNLLEITPAATFSLIVSLQNRRGSALPFFLDPMTYCFGPYIDPESGRKRTDLHALKSTRRDRKSKTEVFAIKDSYCELAAQLGVHFENAVKEGAAIDASSIDDAARRTLCEGVVEYQLKRMGQIRDKEVPTDDVVMKEAFASVDKPTVVFAPYFFIHDKWAKEGLQAAIELTTLTATLKPAVPVHAIVCARDTILGDTAHVQYLIEELPKTNIAGVWLWFDGFDELRAPLDQLVAFRRIVRGLSGKMEIHNLHGGYFSLLLAHDGLTGISHGVGYGEQKPVAQIIGAAAPTVRYYLPPISKRVAVPEVQRCFGDVGVDSPTSFFASVCDCQICKGVIGSDLARFAAFGEMHRASPANQRDTQTPAAAKMCRFHFLIRRLRERSSVAALDASDRPQHVSERAAPWRECYPLRQHLGEAGTGYIEQWGNALREALPGP